MPPSASASYTMPAAPRPNAMDLSAFGVVGVSGAGDGREAVFCNGA
jgi:hypothetical protein